MGGHAIQGADAGGVGLVEAQHDLGDLHVGEDAAPLEAVGQLGDLVDGGYQGAQEAAVLQRRRGVVQRQPWFP